MWILVILLLILMLGGGYGYSSGNMAVGHGGISLFGIVLIILVVMLITGRL